MKKLIYLFPVILLFACGGKEIPKTTEKIDSTFLIRGNAMARISFETISGELKQALENGSVENALRYCNENAFNLTDSLAHANVVSIRRVSNKNRNSRNKADKVEEFLIKGFGNDLNAKKELTSRLVLKDDSVIFYKAILTQPLCLACHGQLERELTAETESLILSLYPYDKATGYQVNQVRGLWRIGFKKR